MPTLAPDRPIAALPGPFATTPRADGIVPTSATRALVDSQVDALLVATPSFLQLDPADRLELANTQYQGWALRSGRPEASYGPVASARQDA